MYIKYTDICINRLNNSMAGLLNKHFVPNKVFKQYCIQRNPDKLLNVRYISGINRSIESLKYCIISYSLTIVRLNFINTSNPVVNAKIRINRIEIDGLVFL